MVDALETADGARAGLAITVEAAGPQALRRYRDFAGPRAKGAAQHPLWFEKWLETTGERGWIVWVADGTNTLAALPLVETRISGLPALAFAGGAHANGNFCPATHSGTAVCMAALKAAIRQALPHVALLSLERQHRTLDAQTNVLAAMATRTSPNIALASSLDGGFAGLLSRTNGKKKSKKRRAQWRRFEDAGGSAVVKPATTAEIDAILDAFFRLKAARFEKAGIADAFGDPQIREFWRALLDGSRDEADVPFSIEALVVGGKPRAITGSTHLRDRTVCEFGAIEDGDLASISPGEYLAYSNLEEACAKGLPLYDFSVGDEAYKRSWCDIEISHFDIVVPLTPAARLAVLGFDVIAGAKKRIKASPQLWALAKAVRRLR